ncbi:MAG: signal peptidase I [Bacteroidota bacterium]
MGKRKRAREEKSRREKEQLTLLEKVRDFFKELGIVLGAFLFLNSFVIASFEVPTGSMENEIMTGDFLFVNKFIYGGGTPRNIPFTDIRLPFFTVPGFDDVERGDVIVFVFPGQREEARPEEFSFYLKRCIAKGGDTLQIVDRMVSVNGEQVPFPRNVKFNISEMRPAGEPDPRTFPPGSQFNEDNYGPLVVPKRGDTLKITSENFTQWHVFIEREGHFATLSREGTVFIDGKQAGTYVVERNYVFGMGDYRDNSLDSRFWGFIPEADIVGSPLIVYWSWDPNTPLWDLPSKLSSIRFERIGRLVK